MREQVTRLAGAMLGQGLDIYIVSDKDEHLSEYTDDHFKALEEFSGFTGGDGTLAVAVSACETGDASGGLPYTSEAALWTDGRYFTQAESELKGSGIKLMKMGIAGTESVSNWIKRHRHDAIGFDGSCTPYTEGQRLIDEVRPGRVSSGIDLCGTVWENRPALRFTPCWVLGEEYTGRSVSDKLKWLREKLNARHAGAHIIAAPDDIAWLLNIRANDIPCNPVMMAYFMLTGDGVYLYTDEEHFRGGGAIARKYLEENGITIKPYHDIFKDIRRLRGSVLIDASRCSYEVASLIPEACEVIKAVSPVTVEKSRKNGTERKNIRIAQHRDSLAVTRFMYWFKSRMAAESKTVSGDNDAGMSSANMSSAGMSSAGMRMSSAGIRMSPGGEAAALTEWGCVEKLHEFRKSGEHFIEESFSTISAYGANAAMAHYAPSQERDVAIEPKGMYLVDSGGQYLEGTTDITRTWCCDPCGGGLTDMERTAYTLSVMAHLRLADAVFPEGTSGLTLDYAARELFWKRGLNFNHGTGHGVGHVLNVHEAPVRIAYMARTLESVSPIYEGTYVSDEPGHYEGGAFGVRIENMLLAVPAFTNGYDKFLKFEICSFCPFDRDCMDISLMSDDDIRLCDAYHERVYEELSGELNEDERRWLKRMCAPLK